MLLRSITLWVLLLLSACSMGPDRDLLIGKWQVVDFMQVDDASQPVDSVHLEEVQFEFLANGRYAYQATLNYKEAGTYRIERQLLYTKDTLDAASVEKAVKIALLTPDSLHFLMNSKGSQQLLKLTRQ